MAFSVVSTMDGSILGSLSASKRRSPGSNNAVGEANEQLEYTVQILNLKKPSSHYFSKSGGSNISSKTVLEFPLTPSHRRFKQIISP